MFETGYIWRYSTYIIPGVFSKVLKPKDKIKVLGILQWETTQRSKNDFSEKSIKLISTASFTYSTNTKVFAWRRLLLL